nr:MAG TPA: hypothetical protein [Caudoviricetes sp.]
MRYTLSDLFAMCLTGSCRSLRHIFLFKHSYTFSISASFCHLHRVIIWNMFPHYWVFQILMVLIVVDVRIKIRPTTNEGVSPIAFLFFLNADLPAVDSSQRDPEGLCELFVCVIWMPVYGFNDFCCVFHGVHLLSNYS